MAQQILSEIDLIGRFRVMQSDVNPRKTDRIIDYIIIYVIFS